MSTNKTSQHKHAAPLAKNKPRFVNPVPFPTVAEFRLDHILAKVLPQETASVSLALLDVCSNYQQDLKGEIRKALAIEQKIQNKNIHAIKRTHKLTKQLKNTRKDLAKVTPVMGEGGSTKNFGKRRNSGLGSEIDQVLVQSISVSQNVKALALRVAELSAKKGGTGIPDVQKYPLLNRFISSQMPVDQTCEGDIMSDNQDNALTLDSIGENGIFPITGGQDTKVLPSIRISTENQENSAFLPRSMPDSTYSLDSGIKPQENTQTAQFSIPETGSLVEPLKKNTSPHSNTENGDEVMDPQAFEMFMNASIAKYRERQDQRSKTLVSSFLETGSTKSIARGPRNPLRLLSSRAIGLVNQDIKLSPFLEQSDPFKFLFLPRKSPATVLETPELSLHKKLRIRVMPLPQKIPENPHCECQAENKNLQKGDVWSSSETHTETENDTDSVLGFSSSSDANSSSDSLGGHIRDTNSYYLALQSNIQLKRKSRRHKKSRRAITRKSEVSPTPKHTPLHRLLQPKQSILKLARGKEDPRVSRTTTLFEQPLITDSGNGQAPELTYTASPRASFINEYSVLGTILHGTKCDSNTCVKNCDLALQETPSISSKFQEPRKDSDGLSDIESIHFGDQLERSQALDKLKSLVI